MPLTITNARETIHLTPNAPQSFKTTSVMVGHRNSDAHEPNIVQSDNRTVSNFWIRNRTRMFWNILRTCAPLPPLTGQGDCSTIALDLERRFAGWKQRRALVRQRTVVMLNVGLWHHFSKIPYSSFGFINRACYALTSSFNHQHVLCFNMTTPNQ